MAGELKPWSLGAQQGLSEPHRYTIGRPWPGPDSEALEWVRRQPADYWWVPYIMPAEEVMEEW